MNKLYLRVEYYVLGIFDLLKESREAEAKLEKTIGDRLESYVIEQKDTL